MKSFALSLLLTFFAVVVTGQTPAIPSDIREASSKGNFSAAANFSASLADGYSKSGDIIQTLFYDSLTLYYARLSNDSLLVLGAINNYVERLLEGGALAKANTLLSEAENSLGISRTEELRWYRNKGSYSFKRFRIDEAMTFYKKGLTKADGYGDITEAMNFRGFIGQSWLYKGSTDSMHLVYEAMDYFDKNKMFMLAFGAASTIGRSFQYSFNPDKALVYFQKAIDFAERTGNKAKAVGVRLSIGETYLGQKKYAAAEIELVEADKFFRSKSDWVRLAVANIDLGRLYTEIDKLEAAKQSFATAENANAIVKSELIKGNIDTYKSLLMAKLKDYRAADSLIVSGLSAIAQNIDKDLVKMADKKMREGSPKPAKDTERVLEFFASKKGSAGKSSGLDIEDFKALQEMNIYTGHTSNEDSTILNTTNRQLLQLETQYKTRIIADSFKLQKQESDIAKQETILAKQESKNKNLIIVASTILLALVAAGLWLQYRSRRRAERDKARIELLQNEIHHRVKNNLAVINRLVDVAGKDSVQDASLAALKTRIKSIELLHRHLYSEEAKTGNISLQAYFEDLCTAIAATFGPAKDVHISVDAPTEVESTVAEKLGLILNELVTNSFKYAFADKKEARITVKAVQNKNGLNLVVEDNGIGLTEEKSKGSYGMKLIKGLSHELKGRFSFHNTGGTQFQLSIPA